MLHQSAKPGAVAVTGQPRGGAIAVEHGAVRRLDRHRVGERVERPDELVGDDPGVDRQAERGEQPHRPAMSWPGAQTDAGRRTAGARPSRRR